MYDRLRRQIIRQGAIRSVSTTWVYPLVQRSTSRNLHHAHFDIRARPPSSRTPPLPHERHMVRRNRSRRLVVALLIAFSMTVIDQGSKALALTQLSENERIPLVGDLLGLQLAFNPGTVMSLGSGSTWVFTVIGVAATIALVYVAWRSKSIAWAVAIGFVWGGAMGNLIDRLLAPPGFGIGHVTDFLAYGNLFIGNIADISIGIGVGLGLIQIIRYPRPELPRGQSPGA